MGFISEWKNHQAGSIRRTNLDSSDERFENAFLKIKPDNEAYVKPGTLLYRVHHKLLPKPSRKDFSGENEYQYELNYVNRINGTGKIDFDNHWVSFTKNPKVIVGNYFKSKGLTGDVIVIKSEKAVDISEMSSLGYDEEEVVAPLDKRNVLEVLTLEEFEEKYIFSKNNEN